MTELSHGLAMASICRAVHLRTGRGGSNGSVGQKYGTNSRADSLVIPLKKMNRNPLK